MRKEIIPAFAAVAAASCLSACASLTASDAPASAPRQALENFSNPDIGFEGQSLTFTCQKDPDFSQLPESVNGVVKDIRTNGTFRIQMLWLLERDKNDMQISATADPIKPRNQTLDIGRLRALGDDLQGKVEKKCASLSPTPPLPPLSEPPEKAAPSLPPGTTVAYLGTKALTVRFG